MNTTQTRHDIPRQDALDGLRALAILLVLSYHLTPDHNSDRGLVSLHFKIIDLGWSGVELFFVLSGYLITTILLRFKNDGRLIRHFYVRRMLRIAPAYYLAILCGVGILPLVSAIYEVPSGGFLTSLLLYVSNHRMQDATYFGHFWSLAVEMQFYFLWPFIIYYVPPSSHRIVVGVMLVVAIVGRLILVLGGAEWAVTFWTVFRMDGLLIGAFVALIGPSVFESRTAKRLLGFALIALATIIGCVAWYGYAGVIATTSDAPNMIALRTMLPLLMSLFYGVVLVLCLQPNALSVALGAAVLKPLALYSYGIYLYHFLLMPLFEQYFHPKLLYPALGNMDLAILIYLVIASAISFGVAMTSYNVFESKFLRLKSRY